MVSPEEKCGALLYKLRCFAWNRARESSADSPHRRLALRSGALMERTLKEHPVLYQEYAHKGHCKGHTVDNVLYCISMKTGQWSEPKMSGNISARFTRFAYSCATKK